MPSKRYKLVVYVPVNDAPTIRELLGKLGAGHAGNYDHTSFSVRGTGRFRPLEGAHPAIGKVGKIEKVTEERIETVVSEDILGKVLREVRSVHPYEEPVIDIYPLFSPPAEGKGEERRGVRVKISGIVKKHWGRGKELGFPTANLEIENGVEDGIYVGYTVIAIRRQAEKQSQWDRHGLRPRPFNKVQGEPERSRMARDDEEEKKLPSLVFVGAAETFGDTDRKAEIYILDFDQDLYGKEIEVELKQKIRDNKKFESAEELVEQMEKDEQIARKYFLNNFPPQEMGRDPSP